MLANLDHYSFSFLMKIYRTRRFAEINNHKMALRILKVKYPDIFLEDFEDFISKIHQAIAVLDPNNEYEFLRLFEAINELTVPEN